MMALLMISAGVIDYDTLPGVQRAMVKRAPMRDMCAYIRDLITQQGKSYAAR